MKAFTCGISLLVVTALSGCSNMSTTEQRTLSGAGIGAAGGAIIGSMSGSAGTGALIGNRCWCPWWLSV